MHEAEQSHHLSRGHPKAADTSPPASRQAREPAKTPEHLNLAAQRNKPSLLCQ